MIPRILNIQGMLGIAASLLLLGLLLVKAGDARHWRKQSSRYEQLYVAEQGAFAQTVANYRAAAETARVADIANADRVAAEQRTISERTTDDLETRLADARARALRLRLGARPAASAEGGAGMAAVPGPGATPGAADSAAEENGLPLADALIATEQAIQLDELIKWVNSQAAINPGKTAETEAR